MRRWNKNITTLSLRAKMVISGMLILLIPLTVIGSATFLKSSRALEEISKEQMVQIARSLSDMIRIALEKDLKIITAVSVDPQIVQERLAGKNEISNRKLADLYRVIGVDYEDLAVFDQQGTISAIGADESRIGISISNREYFKAAREGKAGVGHVVLSKATGRPTFGICAPIISKDGKFLGGVLGVLKADFLMRYISSLKLGKTGYAFMIDRKGKVIAHPNPAYILNFDVRDAPELRELAVKMAKMETGTGEYTYAGVRKVTGFSSVELAGWKIGVTQNKDEIMELAYSNRQFLLQVSAIFIFLTILAVLFLSRTISNPVQKTLTTLNQAISQANEAFIIIGLDRKVQFVNPAMAAITGRPIQDMIGKPLDVGGIERCDMDEIWHIVAEKKKWSGRITGGRTDSSMYTMDFTLTQVRDEGGRINCFLAVGRDISQEQEMQARIRQSEKMEAIGTLAGGIAHDFNNILSAVFGYTELTLNSLADRAKSVRYLTEIMNATKRARDLVNHILAFSRKTEPGQKPMIPKYVIKEALKLLRASLPATISIRDTLTSSAAILGDQTQFHQVIVNLCTNAAYAMKDDGGVLEVNLDETTGDNDESISPSGIAAAGYLRLQVSDSGCGIPAEIKERIFDPFFTTKPQGEGTGLGLSVVHGIVKSLNGAITVSGKREKGTLFTVYLPIIRTDIQDAEEEIQEQLPHGSERILLVDDEEALVQSGKARLEGLGYRVQGFVRPNSALEAFLQAPADYDVVVTDYTMPQMTGYELIKKIRAIRHDIPIILCSGYFLLEEKIKDPDTVEFLKKPVTTGDIAHALRRVLGRSKGISPGATAASMKNAAETMPCKISKKGGTDTRQS